MRSASTPLTKAIVRTLELPRTGRVSVALTPLGIMTGSIGGGGEYLLPHHVASVLRAGARRRLPTGRPLVRFHSLREGRMPTLAVVAIVLDKLQWHRALVRDAWTAIDNVLEIVCAKERDPRDRTFGQVVKVNQGHVEAE